LNSKHHTSALGHKRGDDSSGLPEIKGVAKDSLKVALSAALTALKPLAEFTRASTVLFNVGKAQIGFIGVAGIDAITEQGRGKQIDNDSLKKAPLKAAVGTAIKSLPKIGLADRKIAVFEKYLRRTARGLVAAEVAGKLVKDAPEEGRTRSPVK
jgi:GTPase